MLDSEYWVALFACSVFAGNALAQAAPRPPTALTVFDAGSPTAAVDALRSLVEAHRFSDVSMALDPLDEGELHALANGFSPEAFGLQAPSSAVDRSQWQILVQAYARATLTDRERSSGRAWQLFELFLAWAGGIVTVAIGFVLKPFFVRPPNVVKELGDRPAPDPSKIPKNKRKRR